MFEGENTCRLCQTNTDLQESHVIPKFVFRWMKETAATDYLRFGGTPNRRIQDGIRHRMLCYSCEQLLSVYEKQFSEDVFSLLTKGFYPYGYYGDWLSKFATSLVWRVLASQKIRGVYENIDPALMSEITVAFEHWRKFMRGIEKTPGRFEIHMVQVGGLSDIQRDDLPKNCNRYTLRGVEMDLVTTESLGFVASYAKIGPIAFFGHIVNKVQPWKGSRLAVNRGEFLTKKLVWPPMLLDFFMDRARSDQRIINGISEKKREVTEKEILKNVDRASQSDQFKAFLLDADRFGIEAVSCYDSN